MWPVRKLPPVSNPAPEPETQAPVPWYADGLSFQCTQCGGCCTGGPGYVWFDEAEAEAMAAAKGVDVPTFYERFAKRVRGRWTLEEVRVRRGQYDCVFLERHGGLDSPGRCSIYGQRPTQCRTWPFWDSNLDSPRSWAEAAEDCPGMKLPGQAGGNFVPLEAITAELKRNPEGL